MDMKNNLISICSTFNIFLHSSFTIKIFTAINNLKRCEPTKLQIDEIVLPAYTDLSKRCVACINELYCTPQYIADMLRDFANAIITLYPEFKGNSSDLYFF